jgi:hypothetical protein
MPPPNRPKSNSLAILIDQFNASEEPFLRHLGAATARREVAGG